MSVTLLVKLLRPISLRDVEAAASTAFRGLLNLDHDVLITAEFDESDSVGDRSGGLLTPESSRVVCSLVGYEEEVAIAPFTVPVQVQTSIESHGFANQGYVSIAWHFKKTSLCWALVAAVALAVAKDGNADIEDNSGFFTTENNRRPNDFRDTISLEVPYSDPEVAAEAFFTKLPKSSELADWLRSQVMTDQQ